MDYVLLGIGILVLVIAYEIDGWLKGKKIDALHDEMVANRLKFAILQKQVDERFTKRDAKRYKLYMRNQQELCTSIHRIGYELHKEDKNELAKVEKRLKKLEKGLKRK